MSRTEIITNLKNLQKEIGDYATYVEKYTYHPYDKIESFANKLNHIIDDIENDM